jgi:protein-tyrosine phosphatase
MTEVARSFNVRDLGGLRTVDGRRIRDGVLFRSEALDVLDEPSLGLLEDVRLVIDLRTAVETDASAVRWPRAVPETVSVPVLDPHRVGGVELMSRMGTDPDFALSYMTEIYAEILDALPNRCLKELADRVGGRGQVPVLIHCAAGQDRTGVLVAVLLSALGVPREAVVADYVRSADSWDLAQLTRWMRGELGPDRAISPDALGNLRALARHIETVLDRLVAEHGSIEAYWAAGGVDASALEAMRSVLCTSP